MYFSYRYSQCIITIIPEKSLLGQILLNDFNDLFTYYYYFYIIIIISQELSNE